MYAYISFIFSAIKRMIFEEENMDLLFDRDTHVLINWPVQWCLSRDGELLNKIHRNLTVRFLWIQIWGTNSEGPIYFLGKSNKENMRL